MKAHVRKHLNMDHVLERKAKPGIKKALWMGGTLSQPQNCSKWTFLQNTFHWERCGNFFPVLRWKPMYANTLTWTTSGEKKANQESRKLYGWGVPFPSPKIAQNEHVYTMLLIEKVAVTFFSFGMKAHVRKHLNMDRVREKKQTMKQENFMNGGVPFPSPKIAQNEHFYIILSTEKVAVTFFSVLGWRPMYANTLTWTTSGKKKQTRNQESFMDGGYPFPAPKLLKMNMFT